MKLRRLTLALAAALAAGTLSTAACAAPALPDGMGGYYNPQGNRDMSDGAGGYYTDDGHLMPNGTGGYFNYD